MTPTANLASTEADADHVAAPAAEAGPYVLNLCSSTTPMALAQTDLPELKRFTFFVSRRFEEGRERFRLHMGFFTSQAEAEEWLGVVREIYPGAWAGEAPGKKLRARAAEAAAVQARHATGPQKSAARPAAPAPAPAAIPLTRPQSAQPAPASIPALIPTLHPPVSAAAAKATPQAPLKRVQAAVPPKAAPPPKAAVVMATKAARASSAAGMAQAPGGAAAPGGKASAANTVISRPAARAAAPATAQPRPAASPRPAAVPSQTAVSRQTAVPPRQTAVPRAASQPGQAASPARRQPAKKPIFADSNVKEVLAALDSPADGTGETRLMPVIAGRGDPADDSSLTDTQVLRFLEARREEPAARPQTPLQSDAAAESGISLLKPDDTGTRQALKEAVSHNDPVSFAVQLQWSVQPVALEQVPPLAIFSAYTLYSVEGSREGRKWYGLRLGFFNDAISAKQVAYYVRSEFNSVAVVPVSPQERERATEDNQRFSGGGAARKRRESADHEFKLIDSDTDTAPPAASGGSGPDQDPAPGRPPLQRGSPSAGVAPVAQQPAPAARNGRKAGGTSQVQPGLVGARERRTPQTLEETLEILGANELAIDNGRGESLNDTGVRHLRVEVQKNTPFSRLLERLSERVRKA